METLFEHKGIKKVRFSKGSCSGCGRDLDGRQGYIHPDGQFCMACFKKKYPELHIEMKKARIKATIY